MSERVNREVKYCILQYMQEEGNTQAAETFARENKLLFSLQHFLDLITTNALEQADVYLRSFLSPANKSDFRIFFLLRKFWMINLLAEHHYDYALRVFSLLKQIPEVQENQKLSRSLSYLFLVGDLTKEPAIRDMGNLNLYRLTHLIPELINEVKKNPNLKNILEMPNIKDKRFRMLISQAFKFQHMKNCNGTSKESFHLNTAYVDHRCNTTAPQDAAAEEKQLFSYRSTIELPQADVTALACAHDVLFVGFSTGRFIAANIKTGDVLFSTKEKDPITHIAVSMPFFAYVTSLRVVVMMLGRTIRTLNNFMLESVSSLVFVPGLLVVAFVSKHSLYLCDCISSQPTRSRLKHVVAVMVQSDVNNGVVAIRQKDLVFLTVLTDKKLHRKSTVPLGISVARVINTELLVDDTARQFIVIPKTDSSNPIMLPHSTSHPVLTGTSDFVFTSTGDSINILNTTTCSVLDTFSAPALSVCLLTQSLFVGAIANLPTLLFRSNNEFQLTQVRWNGPPTLKRLTDNLPAIPTAVPRTPDPVPPIPDKRVVPDPVAPPAPSLPSKTPQPPPTLPNKPELPLPHLPTPPSSTQQKQPTPVPLPSFTLQDSSLFTQSQLGFPSQQTTPSSQQSPKGYLQSLFDQLQQTSSQKQPPPRPGPSQQSAPQATPMVSLDQLVLNTPEKEQPPLPPPAVSTTQTPPKNTVLSFTASELLQTGVSVRKLTFAQADNLVVETPENAFMLYATTPSTIKSKLPADKPQIVASATDAPPAFRASGCINRGNSLFIVSSGLLCSIVKLDTNEVLRTFNAVSSWDDAISFLTLFPEDSNLIVVGTMTGRVGVMRAKLRFCNSPSERTLESPIVAIRFLHLATGRFVCCSAAGKVQVVQFTKNRVEFVGRQINVGERIVECFVTPDDAFVYIVSPQQIVQVNLQTFDTTKVVVNGPVADAAFLKNQLLILLENGTLALVSAQNGARKDLQTPPLCGRVVAVCPFHDNTFLVANTVGNVFKCNFTD